MHSKIITRFAPSPTGYLHVGGARTALFNYLFAKKNKGKFLLRIEDTDKKRSDSEMTRQIFDSLKWLNLHWEQSVIHQADNADYHQSVAMKLLESANAYRCFCTKTDLEERRKSTDPRDAKAYYYDKHCTNLPPEKIAQYLEMEKPFALRLAIPEGKTKWNDLVHGGISVDNSEIDDFVILRSDKTPIYHLAVVADDHRMGITHVIRGDDHISNTPKQIQIYRAMDWQIPEFAHVPLILGTDKKRLSKRHGATAVSEYQARGILPAAMLNYLLLLGWSPGDDREIFSLSEMIEIFSLDGISSKGAVFDDKKLNWINSRYLSQMPDDEILAFLQDHSPEIFEVYEQDVRLKIISLLKPRVKSMNDFITQSKYFYHDPAHYDPKGVRKHLKTGEVFRQLKIFREKLTNCSEFIAENIEKVLRDLAEDLDISAAKIVHPTRLAITGLTATPGLFEIMEILGRDVVLRRMTELIRQQEALTEDGSV